MRLQGEFLTQHGARVALTVDIDDGRYRVLEIGSDAAGIYFSEDPVEITDENTDTAADTPLLRRAATLRLLCRDYVPELFRASCFEARVCISRDGHCIFRGFIEPMAYRQDFNAPLDLLEVNCIDCLSALQYVRYRRAGTPDGPSYAEAVASAGVRPLQGIIDDCMEAVADDGFIPELHYDGSRRPGVDATASDMFDAVGISELLLLGDDEDDVWTLEDALSEALRYLGLHMTQLGDDFYIFAREALCCGAEPPLAISIDNVGDADTRISIGEVYNRVELTCDLCDPGAVVESPLEQQALTPLYVGRQKYLSEYSMPFEKGDAFLMRRWEYAVAMYRLAHGLDDEITKEEAARTEVYVRVYDNPRWRFFDGLQYPTPEERILVGQSSEVKRLALLDGSGIVAFGRDRIVPVERRKDNAPVPSLDMQTYLCVSVNGNGVETEGGIYPSESSLRAAAPRAVYDGRYSGASLSPADDSATNYLVISGTMTLLPLVDVSCTPDELDTVPDFDFSDVMPAVDTTLAGKKRFYSTQFWHASQPGDTPVREKGKENYGLIPPSDEFAPAMEFKYSAIGDRDDHVSKVGVLACMLRIGDKCLVETGDGSTPDCYKWRPFKPQTQCADDDEYYAQSFTIGFNPKIGDHLIGQEHPVQNTVDFNMGIDAEGMAIPIRRNDCVSGAVHFEILGPANIVWDDVTRRHPTFFRHTRWTSTSRPLLANVRTIFIRDFTIKFHTDSGLMDSGRDDAELVYVSDEAHGFTNVFTPVEHRICSALTAAERAALGCPPTDGSVSVAVSLPSGAPLLSVYDAVTGTVAKPEQLCVDALYSELHRPRIILEQTLEDCGDNVRRFGLYIHPALPGRRFVVQGITSDLIRGTARLTLKETWL